MTSPSPVDAVKIAPHIRASGSRRDDLVYQVVIVAAMVAVLASAWVF
jgi:hypothetical protein